MIYDAAIIGGGPAGATTALFLAKAGWSVALVEKRPFPRHKVCGEFISATTLPLLHALGIGKAFEELAGPEIRRVGLFAGDSVFTAPMPAPRGTSAKWGRALAREYLDTMLLEAAAAAGVQLWQPWTAIALNRRMGGYTCVLAAKQERREIASRLIIAAHGSWERGPFHDAPGDSEAGDLLAFKAHMRGGALSPDLMPLIVFPGGYGGMVTTDHGRITLSCCIRRDVLEQCRQDDRNVSAGAAVFNHIRGNCRGVRQAVSDARLEGPWLSTGPIRPGIRRGYANGIFFVGNLAGEAHPIVAEGISMAMQSASLLAQLLIAGEGKVRQGCLDEIGIRYEQAWRSLFGTRVRAAALFAHLALRPNTAKLWVPTVHRFPGLLTLGARLSGKARLPR